jgi:hypothetical protein
MANQPTELPIPPPDWQSAYKAALRESDTHNLFKLVEIAEAALLTRRDDLAGVLNCLGEREAVDDALNKLRVLKQKRLSFVNEPDSLNCNSTHEGNGQADW